MTASHREKHAKRAYAELLERKARVQECLPHLYAFHWYEWAIIFFNCLSRFVSLNAANQIGKSSYNIRKAIHWATEKTLWPKLWPKHHKLGKKPTQFWYFYPDWDVVLIEFEEKWVKEWLPRDEMKDHPQYGWKVVYGDKRVPRSIKFNSGITIYFKVYSQDVFKLQASTLYAVFADEEMPPHFWTELVMRLNSTDGYFNIVKTSTVDDPFWDDFNKGKIVDDAKIIQVSMYDCLTYVDSDEPTPWTLEKIQRIEKSIPDETERRIRVHGESGFSKSSLKYWGFRAEHNYIKPYPVPKNWLIYSGVDLGGGGSGHPAAIAFIAVNPEFTKARAFKLWRGDGINTTSGDILRQWLIMRDRMIPVASYYDYNSKDFYLTAQRAGIPFMKAEKAHDRGEDILNTLFQMGMLKVFESPDGSKLVDEISRLKKSTLKRNAKDDLCDALRYAVTQIPWNYVNHIKELTTKEIKKTDPYEGMTSRMREYNEEKEKRGTQPDNIDELFNEIEEANEFYEISDY